MSIIKNFRNLFALVYLGVFILWLAVVCLVLLPMVLKAPDGLDPMMALVAGLGIGGVTQFFIVVGTLIYQFYFRKANAEETPPATTIITTT